MFARQLAVHPTPERRARKAWGEAAIKEQTAQIGRVYGGGYGLYALGGGRNVNGKPLMQMSEAGGRKVVSERGAT